MICKVENQILFFLTLFLFSPDNFLPGYNTLITHPTLLFLVFTLINLSSPSFKTSSHFLFVLFWCCDFTASGPSAWGWLWMYPLDHGAHQWLHHWWHWRPFQHSSAANCSPKTIRFCFENIIFHKILICNDSIYYYFVKWCLWVWAYPSTWWRWKNNFWGFCSLLPTVSSGKQAQVVRLAWQVLLVVNLGLLFFNEMK